MGKELKQQIMHTERWIAQMVACALSGTCTMQDRHQYDINRELQKLAELKAKQHS